MCRVWGRMRSSWSDDAARSTIRPGDILSWSRDRMASYTAARSVVFVDGLPRSESNKISWRLLQDAEWKL